MRRASKFKSLRNLRKARDRLSVLFTKIPHKWSFEQIIYLSKKLVLTQRIKPSNTLPTFFSGNELWKKHPESTVYLNQLLLTLS